MRAHGNTPGPTQRPLLAGAIDGAAAAIPTGLILWKSEALESIARALGMQLGAALAWELAVLVAAGVLYGRVFGRAANDRGGGWLFGIGYGFLFWMLGPATLLPLRLHRPIAVGPYAMWLLGAHLIYGLALGILFPWVHGVLQRKMNHSR